MRVCVCVCVILTSSHTNAHTHKHTNTVYRAPTGSDSAGVREAGVSMW